MLLDTDYVVNFLRGRNDTVPFVNSLTDAGTARVSAITVAEVLEGIFFGATQLQPNGPSKRGCDLSPSWVLAKM